MKRPAASGRSHPATRLARDQNRRQLGSRGFCHGLPGALLVWLTATAFAGAAGLWPDWRGPVGTGAARATNLPACWGPGTNIVWRTVLPGSGASTPAVSSNRVFVTAAGRGGELFAVGVDRATGEVLWRLPVGQGHKLDLNTGATPSPVIDDRRAYFLFGAGQCVATDPDGHLVWQRELERDYGRFVVRFGYSSSPLLCGDCLVVVVIQGDPDNEEPTDAHPATAGFLLGLDPATGRTLWKTPRPSTGEGECQEAYSSPIKRRLPGGDVEVLTVGGDCLTAHDPRTGRERWRWSGYNESRDPIGRVISSPLVADDVIVVCAPRHAAAFGVRPGGDPPDAAVTVAWSMEQGPDVPTPLYYRGLLYFLDGDERILYAARPDTGEVVWIGELASREVFRGSPTGADGRIYCISEDGEVFVASAGERFELLAHVDMSRKGRPRDCQATIVAVDDRLYIRTGDVLTAVGRVETAGIGGQ